MATSAESSAAPIPSASSTGSSSLQLKSPPFSPPILGNQGNNIKVICRFRPQNSIEDSHNGVPIVTIDEDSVSCRVESRDYPGQFNFDKIFDWNAEQRAIFDYCGIPLVEQCFDGFNSTLFCYGQTGSGKTHTMMGPNVEDPKSKGMTPRLVEQIFKKISEAPSSVEFTVKASFLEIYMEKIRDLLNPLSDNLPIHEDRNHGVYVKGLKDVYVSSVPEVYEVIKIGNEVRSVASTNMNEQSSRSHSIFIITISQKDTSNGNLKSGKLYLVDLAGSEKVGKTGATGQALEEAKKINKSLTALGMVINSLTDGKSTHVPYRDSKLTRILQESLGGNSKTTLIINCSPSSYNDAETISTLRFGTRAKSITNKAVMNVELSAAELKVILKKSNVELSILRSYIAALEEEVKIWRSGGTVEKENYATKLITAENLPSNESKAESIIDNGTLVKDDAAISIGAAPLPDDERDEYLQRENELTDQLAEKETELQKVRTILENVQSDLKETRSKEQKLLVDNGELLRSVADLRVEMERLQLENKDAVIIIETLRDSNLATQNQVNDLKQQLEEYINKSSSPAVIAFEREKMKSEKTAQMMKDMGVEDLASKEAEIRNTLDALNGQSTVASILSNQNEAANQAQQLEEKLKFAQKETAHLAKMNEELLTKCRDLEEELAELYDKAIADEERKDSTEQSTKIIQDLKAKLEAQFSEKQRQFEGQIHNQQEVISQRESEIQTMKNEILHLQTALENFASGNNLPSPDDDTSRLKQMMTRQMDEFEQIKKSLMKDLQDRCEKVVELEITLDDLREQNENLLQKQNAKAEQKKMAFLEQNLEQLTKLQKQLVEQNAVMKKNADTLEKKILNRNERINDLEKLLKELNEKYSELQEIHELEIQDLRKKISDNNAQLAPLAAHLSFGNSRIAKPVRGGQDPVDDDSDSDT